MTAAPKRRWFRFSLRTLFVAVTIFGVCLIVLPKLKWIWDRHQLLAGGNIFSGEPAPAPLPLRMLGEKGVQTVYVKVRPDLFNKEHAHELFPEAEIVMISFQGDPPESARRRKYKADGQPWPSP